MLYVLRAMGHGDKIAIVDANFPAEKMSGKIIRLDGISATIVLEAVLEVLPLDSYADDAALTMQMVSDPEKTPNIVSEFQKIIDQTSDCPQNISPVERFSFYKSAAEAFAIVQTGERRLFGNIILRKGVVK